MKIKMKEEVDSLYEYMLTAPWVDGSYQEIMDFAKHFVKDRMEIEDMESEIDTSINGKSLICLLNLVIIDFIYNNRTDVYSKGKNYGDIVFLDLEKQIKANSAMRKKHDEFSKYYIDYLGIDNEKDSTVIIRSMNTSTLYGLISDILDEYEDFELYKVLGKRMPD
jgi:hypothetical protein